MSIRMKLANWLSGGRLNRFIEAENRVIEGNGLLYKTINHLESERAKLECALKRIYDTPCGPKANGTQRKIRRIAAHALWKE